MGTSTVSGPFRSQNGFQELVNGVWTPVGSGGGNVTSVIIPRPEYSNVDIEMPPPTEIGQVYRYSLGPVTGLSSGTVYIRIPGFSLPTLKTFCGGYPVFDTGGGGVLVSVASYGVTTSIDDTITVDGGSVTVSFDIEIVYIGIDSEGYARYSVSGQLIRYLK